MDDWYQNWLRGSGIAFWACNILNGEVRFEGPWAEMIGFNPATLEPPSLQVWRNYIHPKDWKRSRKSLEAYLAGESVRYECEMRIRHGDGGWVWVLDSGAAKPRTANGGPEWIFGYCIEITHAKLREEALRKSEQFLERSGRVAGVGAWEIDLATGEVTWSHETYHILGAPLDYRPTLQEALSLYSPESKPIIAAAVERASSGDAGFDLELAINRFDSRQILVRVVGAPDFADGRPIRLSGAIQDITIRAAERLAVQQAMERVTAARLQSAAEREGLRIVRELSDQLEPALTGMKLDLDWIVRKHGSDGAVWAPLVQDTMKAIDSTISALKRLATELRPAMLDALGLAAAIQWHTEEFERRTGISCSVHVPDAPLGISADQNLAMLRIYQEALTNIARHARATSVLINLHRDQNTTILTIHDDGVGFDASMLEDEPSHGLTSMRERSLTAGGQLRIESGEGSGTTITLQIPSKERRREHSKAVRVLIVDDHVVIHEGLKRVLEEEFKGAAFGDAYNFGEALDLVRRERWDVAILAIGIPGRGGLELQKDIHAERPRLPILIFSTQPEDQYAIRALKGGASGYLTKGSAVAEIILAIHKVIRGGKYVSAALAEKLASGLGQTDPTLAPKEILSNREFEVLRLIATGKNTSAIAVQLSLSVKTVSTYRTRILAKLNLTNTTELIRYALDLGLDH